MLKKLTVFCLLILVLATPFAAWAQEDTEWAEFTNSAGTLTFSYPADWVVFEEEDSSVGITIATSQEALDILNESEDAPVFPAGEFAIGLLFPTADDLTSIASDLDPASENYYADLVETLALLFAAGMVDADAAVEPVTTPEPLAEPLVVEPSEEFPYTYTAAEIESQYTIVSAESEFTVYGYDTELEAQDFSVLVYEAGEEVVGVALLIGSSEATEADLANSVKVLQILESVEYTPPAE